jgi:anti-sigma regulatory factor (Ser/Thr protein kinase)
VHSPTVIPVEDASRVAEVRRNATAIAIQEGLDETAVANSAIVASELATNLVKYAQKGEIHLLPLSGRSSPGLEILSIDRGPGIADLQGCLADGYSTRGTSGTGLGAVRRLSNQFEVHSLPEWGTIIVAQVTGQPASSDFLLGVAAKPVRGETVTGDAWATRMSGNSRLLVVADGLGHGVQAAEASGEAIRIFLKSSADSAVELVQQIHAALKGSRGAAVSVAKLDQNTVHFAGLGNVAGVIANSNGQNQTKSMISQNGTAWLAARNVKEFEYPTAPGDLIILHSDGLASHWNLHRSPGLLRKSPAVIAGSLYRDYARERDDVCVIVGARI